MKIKLFILIVVFFSYCSSLISQDVINPYADYSVATSLNPLLEMPHYEITNPGNLIYPFNTLLNGTGGNGATEYMINFNQLWWFNNCNGLDLSTHKKSYKIEIVGFPFVMACAYPGALGCGDNSTSRTLEMPTISLDDDQSGMVNNIWREKGNIEVPGIMSEQADLISEFFVATSPVSNAPNAYAAYPHTTHKITLYIHCGPNLTDDKIDSLVFLYDFTRGRMRDYPFTSTNTFNGYGSSHWDFTMRPRLLYKNYTTNGHTYQETINNDIYINGTTINYFPFETNSCNDFSDFSDNFIVVDPNPTCNSPFDNDKFGYIHPAPFCLTSYLPYQGYGVDDLAGYDRDPNSGQLSIQQGINHNYQIQSNYDFTTINPFEKIIYNPSEVSITPAADNLIFPSDYTFKTIRGVYPTATEVGTDQSDPQTGGLYNDERFVPVRTDLRCENSSYPQTTTPIGNSVYASMYYLENGSKLTIEPCVQIYDATFEVRPGATLKFENHPYILGFEDVSSNIGRYKILGTGGAVLRNYDDIQYVQNGIITQTDPLQYIAVNSIEAGYNVDPDGDRAVGNYQLEQNSDVTFVADDFIHLTDGFDAKAGSSFSAYTQNGISPTPCSFNINGNPQQRKAQVNTDKKVTASISVNPNPYQSNSKIFFTGFVGLKKIKVTNAMGKTVVDLNSIFGNSSTINMTGFSSDVYFVNVSDDSGNRASAKLIVNN